MKDQIERILKMLEEGKISSAQASELIDAIKSKAAEGETEQHTSSKDKTIRVKILSRKGDDVSINLPLKFVQSSIKAFGKIPINVEGSQEIDMQQLSAAIESGMTGKIIQVMSKKGDQIEVTIE